MGKDREDWKEALFDINVHHAMGHFRYEYLSSCRQLASSLACSIDPSLTCEHDLGFDFDSLVHVKRSLESIDRSAG